MTKDQVIEKTLREMGRHWSWGQDSDDSDYPPTVIAELQRKLPDGNIKTCGAFGHLNAACCDTCHTFYAHYEMRVIDLLGGGKAWVCHDIEWAIHPERYAELMEWARNSPLSKPLGNADRPKD